jgi:ABC-type multidrug transport system permease subunit
MYSWKAFTIALIVSEFPYLVVCAALFFNCWYWTAGMAVESSKSGSMFFVFFLYEFLYTGIGKLAIRFHIDPN